jgi:hypothetical protein
MLLNLKHPLLSKKIIIKTTIVLTKYVHACLDKYIILAITINYYSTTSKQL